MNESLSTIIFDFDGTIADSLYKGIEITNQIAKQLNLKTIKPEEIETLRNMTQKEMIKYFKIPIYKIPILVAKYHKEFNKIIDTLLPFKDMKQVIKQLSEKYNLGILSSNSQENIEKFLYANNISQFFKFIHSQPQIFSKSFSIKKIMRFYKLKNNNIIYIGDEVRDIEAAKQAKIPIISVSWGANSKQLLQKYYPNYLVDNPEELLNILL